MGPTFLICEAKCVCFHLRTCDDIYFYVFVLVLWFLWHFISIYRHFLCLVQLGTCWIFYFIWDMFGSVTQKPIKMAWSTTESGGRFSFFISISFGFYFM